MADITIKADIRRTDQRSNVRYNPFWMTTAPITFSHYSASTDAVILATFPLSLGNWFIDQAIIVVGTVFDGTTPSITVGVCTLATDLITTGGVMTVVDIDYFFNNTSVAPTALGRKTPANSEAFATALSANTCTAGGRCFIGADTTVYCLMAAVTTSSGTPTTGSAVVHFRMNRIPS